MTHNLRRAGILEILLTLDADGPADAGAIADAIVLDRERTEKVLSTLNHTDTVIEPAGDGAWALTGAGEEVVKTLHQSRFDTDAFMDAVQAYRRAGKDVAEMRDDAFDIAADV